MVGRSRSSSGGGGCSARSRPLLLLSLLALLALLATAVPAVPASARRTKQPVEVRNNNNNNNNNPNSTNNMHRRRIAAGGALGCAFALEPSGHTCASTSAADVAALAAAGQPAAWAPSGSEAVPEPHSAIVAAAAAAAGMRPFGTAGGGSSGTADDVTNATVPVPAWLALPAGVTAVPGAGNGGAAAPTISVCSNGWVSLGPTTSRTLSNRALPSTSTPNAMLAPFWADLLVPIGGNESGAWIAELGTEPNRRFIIEYYAVPFFGTNPSQAVGRNSTFQVVLYEGQDYFDYRFGELYRPDDVTIGWEDAAGVNGMTLAFDGTGYVPPANSAVRFTPTTGVPLGLATPEGRIRPGSSLTGTLVVNLVSASDTEQTGLIVHAQINGAGPVYSSQPITLDPRTVQPYFLDVTGAGTALAGAADVDVNVWIGGSATGPAPATSFTSRQFNVPLLANDPVSLPYQPNMYLSPTSFEPVTMSRAGATDARIDVTLGPGGILAGDRGHLLTRAARTASPVTNYLDFFLNLGNRPSLVSDPDDLGFTVTLRRQGPRTSLPNNKIWVRGSETDPWIEAYDLANFRNTSSSSNPIDPLHIDLKRILLNASQDISSSTQIRLGEESQDAQPAGLLVTHMRLMSSSTARIRADFSSLSSDGVFRPIQIGASGLSLRTRLDNDYVAPTVPDRSVAVQLRLNGADVGTPQTFTLDPDQVRTVTLSQHIDPPRGQESVVEVVATTTPSISGGSVDIDTANITVAPTDPEPIELPWEWEWDVPDARFSPAEQFAGIPSLPDWDFEDTSTSRNNYVLEVGSSRGRRGITMTRSTNSTNGGMLTLNLDLAAYAFPSVDSIRLEFDYRHDQAGTGSSSSSDLVQVRDGTNLTATWETVHGWGAASRDLAGGTWRTAGPFILNNLVRRSGGDFSRLVQIRFQENDFGTYDAVTFGAIRIDAVEPSDPPEFAEPLLGTWAIVGIVGGGVLLLCAVGAVCFVRHRKRNAPLVTPLPANTNSHATVVDPDSEGNYGMAGSGGELGTDVIPMTVHVKADVAPSIGHATLTGDYGDMYSTPGSQGSPTSPGSPGSPGSREYGAMYTPSAGTSPAARPNEYGDMPSPDGHTPAGHASIMEYGDMPMPGQAGGAMPAVASSSPHMSYPAAGAGGSTEYGDMVTPPGASQHASEYGSTG